MGLYIETDYVTEDTESGERYGGGSDGLVETGFETTGDLFRALAGREPLYSYRALGRCTGKVYIDTPEREAVQVGWVFVSREKYEDDPKRTYLREAWVTVKTAPDTVVRTPHYAAFGGKVHDNV